MEVFHSAEASNVVDSAIQRVTSILYSTVLIGEINAFESDSFDHPLSVSELKMRGRNVRVEQFLEDKNDSFSVVDTFIYSDFNKHTDISSIGYVHQVTTNNTNVAKNLVGFYLVYQASYNSIDLGPSPLFYIKIEDARSVLPEHLLNFLIASDQIFQIQNLDEMLAYSAQYENLDHCWYIHDVLNNKAKSSYHWDNTHVDVLSLYIKGLPYLFIEQSIHQEPHALYSESTLKTRVSDIESKMTIEFIMPIIDPNFPDDPYSFIDTVVQIRTDYQHSIEKSFYRITKNEEEELIAHYLVLPNAKEGIYFKIEDAIKSSKGPNKVLWNLLGSF